MVDTVARRGKDEFSERVKMMRREWGQADFGHYQPYVTSGSKSADFSAVW